MELIIIEYSITTVQERPSNVTAETDAAKIGTQTEEIIPTAEISNSADRYTVERQEIKPENKNKITKNTDTN